jgi:hypothetical protein
MITRSTRLLAVGLMLSRAGPAFAPKPAIHLSLSSGSVSDFSRQALSLVSIETLNPLLPVSRSAKAAFARDTEIRWSTPDHWSDRSVFPLDVSKSNRCSTASISQGYTISELNRWGTHLADDEMRQVRLRATRAVSIAQKAVDSVTLDILGRRSMIFIHRRFRQNAGELLMALSDWDPDVILWFTAEVASPYRYLLGHKCYGLAADLISFLKELQETGTATDNRGEVITSLVDPMGKPYRNLVGEYVLHEKLEFTDLKHDEIIALTTELYGYGAYMAADYVGRERRLAPGTRVFTRAGQTPLGQGLRSFIDWRFKERLETLLGKGVRISYFDPSYRSVLSLQGMAQALGSAHSSKQSLRVVHGSDRVDLPLERIVRIDNIRKRFHGTFADAATVSPEHVSQRVEAGFPVTLTEPQLRILAGIWSSASSVVTRMPRELIAARDAAGRQLRSGTRLDSFTVALVVEWGMALANELARSGLQLTVEDVIFNWPGPPGDARFGWQGMPIDYRRHKEDQFFQELAEHLQNAMLTFTHVTLTPYRTRQVQIAADGPRVHTPTKNCELFRAA